MWNYALNEVAIRGSAEEDYVRRELAGGCASVTGDGESALTIHRKIREALLKSAAIGGLPKVCLFPFTFLWTGLELDSECTRRIPFPWFVILSLHE